MGTVGGGVHPFFTTGFETLAPVTLLYANEKKDRTRRRFVFGVA